MKKRRRGIDRRKGKARREEKYFYEDGNILKKEEVKNRNIPRIWKTSERRSQYQANFLTEIIFINTIHMIQPSSYQ